MKRSGWVLSKRWIVSSRPLPEPPVRFTRRRIFLRSMTGRSVSGVARKSIFSPTPTPLTDFARIERWVWMSITGYRDFGTLVSGTWSMLLGRKSARSSFILPAPSGDLSWAVGALNAVDGKALATAAVPKLSNQRLRLSLLTIPPWTFVLTEKQNFRAKAIAYF